MSAVPAELVLSLRLLSPNCVSAAPPLAFEASNEAIRVAYLDSLIAAVALGESTAMMAIDTATRGLLFSVARRILRNGADAEEVVNDVYFRLWASAADFDPSLGTATAWLVAVCKNASIDKLRRRAARARLLYPYPVACDPAEQTPESLLQASQQLASLLRQLHRLSPVRQKILALAFQGELSHEEVSRVVGMPLGTVKSNIRRALRQLRGFLGPSP